MRLSPFEQEGNRLQAGAPSAGVNRKSPESLPGFSMMHGEDAYLRRVIFMVLEKSPLLTV